MKSEKLEKLSKKFGIASKLSDDLSDLVEEIQTTDLVATPIATHELTVIEENINDVELEEEIFSTKQLKTDFLMIKQNLNSLIVKGQRILDSAMVLDLADLKSSQLDALTNLQNSIANNLKLMINIYKEIAEIEKLRNKNQPKIDQQNGNINTGTIVNNNILLQGSTNDLLDLINKHSIK